ncbi:MAG: DUF3179 domain-containing protein, partial [Acidimicrobiia bacterium]|nr:DUF3179 domain-containing protein [Acidimicrobiia bacterium]
SEVYQTVDYDAAPAASALRDDRESDEFPPPLIEPDRIVSGGVPPDGIPAIDSPQFAPIDQTDFLQPNEGLIVVQVEDEAKAYPIQILIWHEIVNDEIGGLPVTVTYCPLCNSALAFDRRVGSRLLDFGTSGELYQSALVMYDRQTESLWAHFTGQGLVGHYAGATLTPVPAQMLSFEKVEARFPGALVLTRDTGHARPYGTNPYIGYDEETTDPFGPFFDGEIDPRLPPKARVVGVTIDDDAYAINITEPESTTVVEVSVAGQDLVVFHRPGLASALDRASVATGRDVGQTGTFLAADGDGNPLTFAVDQDRFIDNETGSEWTLAGEAAAGKMAGQSLEPVPQLNTFWFAWSTYHPETGLVDG